MLEQSGRLLQVEIIFLRGETTRQINLSLLFLFLLIFGLSFSCKKTKEEPGKGKALAGKKKSYHGFKGGPLYPADPEYHKGTYLAEKVKKRQEKESAHPDNPAEVVSKYTQLLRENPDNASFYLMRGAAQALKKDYEKAISDYQKALKISPAYAEAYSNLGFVYLDLNELDRALSYQRQSLKINPRLANAYYGLALIYQQKGLVKEAINSWEQYLKLAPPSAIWRKYARQRLESLLAKE